jgi:NAD(P)-dependent dehydrogenase (short-subunit alcohol dehydrogenase family)
MGRATAVLFAREGANVLLVDRSQERVDETMEVLRLEGLDASVAVGDITNPDDCRAVITAAVEQLGGIDVLQNTVGILGAHDPVELDEDEWRTVLDINLTGMWRMSKEASKVMREQRSGSIINYSSLAALPGRANGVYGVSKAGVNALTTTLASFNAPYHIRVNAIMPGLLDTPMAVEGNAQRTGADREAVAARREAMCPMGFAGDGWDCAWLGVYLASDESRYVSGACIPVDGAYSSSVAFRA